VLLCVVLMGFGASAEAQASSRVFAVGDPGLVTATAPVGEGVVWAATPPGQPSVVARTDAAGTRELGRFPAGERSEPAVRLQAVDGQVGVTRTEGVCLDAHDCKYQLYSYVATDLLAGPADGALTRVGGCTSVRSCARRCEVPAAPELEVGGGAVAVVDPCAERATITEADGTTRALTGVDEVRLAGPWAAVVRSSEPDTAVLLRRSDGAEVARLAGDYGVWLQADGTFVTRSLAPAARDVLRVAGPPDWAPRAIGPMSPYEQPAGLAGGRLLLLGSDAAGLRVTVRPVDGGPAIQRRLGWVSGRSLGFDGARLTWPERPCAVTSVVSWDLDADPTPPRLPAACGAARVLDSSAVVRGGRVRLRIACAAQYAQGCNGILRVLGPGLRRWAWERATLTPGQTASRTLALPREALRTIRRRDRVRATAVFDARHGPATRHPLVLAAG
jgi:hypothetical protein